MPSPYVNSGPVEQWEKLLQVACSLKQRPATYMGSEYDPNRTVKELKAEKDAQQQQIAAMEASLAALKQVVGAHTTPERLSFSSLSAGWPLFGGCFSSG